MRILNLPEQAWITFKLREIRQTPEHILKRGCNPRGVWQGQWVTAAQ